MAESFDSQGGDAARAGDLQAEKRRFRTAVFFSELPPGSRMTLLAILEHVRDMSAGAWPSEGRIARMTGFSRRSVGAHVRTAEKAGWLVRARRPLRGGRFGGNCYLLTIPRDRAQILLTVATPDAVEKRAPHRGQKTTSPWAKNGLHRGQNLPTNPYPKGTHTTEPEAPECETEAAAVNKGKLKEVVCEGWGRGGVVSIEARRKVCAKLAIGNADPLVALYDAWPRSRAARDPDGLFIATAPKFYCEATEAVRAACQPFAAASLAPTPLPAATASPELRAALSSRGSRYARA